MSQATSKGAELLRSLRAGLSYRRETSWPGSEAPIVLRPLSMDELQQAHAAAEKRFKVLGIANTPTNASDLMAEIQIQLLSVALLDPSGERLFSSAMELRSLVTADERDALVDEYLSVQEEANPRPESMSEELFDAIEGAIKKKDASLLSSFGSRTLALFLISGAAQPSS